MSGYFDRPFKRQKAYGKVYIETAECLVMTTRIDVLGKLLDISRRAKLAQTRHYVGAATTKKP